MIFYFIIEDLGNLYLQKNFHRLREIAEAAGTTIGNLTYHFPHKEELIAEIQNTLHLDFFHLFPDKESGDWLEALVHSMFPGLLYFIF